ncbi:hypothetical protein C8R43DRAFT_900707, partial [Mycena crocata]
MQMVNSLTSKLQIGSPMASLYLLGNPDHYTNLTFKVMWWKSYLVATTNVDDYVYRPESYEDVCLYDYFQMTSKRKRSKKQAAAFKESLKDRDPTIVAHVQEIERMREEEDEDDDWVEKDDEENRRDEQIGDWSDAVSFHPFKFGHPQWETHYVRCDRRDLERVVPNFVGGSLPRMDQGNREFYCRTMLTLFHPWRKGTDLRKPDDSWDETFVAEQFTPKATQMMKNFNLRYECNDARDDYSALSKVNKRALPTFSKWTPDEEIIDASQEFGEYGEDFDTTPVDVSVAGEKWKKIMRWMNEAGEVMKDVGWL